MAAKNIKTSEGVFFDLGEKHPSFTSDSIGIEMHSMSENSRSDMNAESHYINKPIGFERLIIHSQCDEPMRFLGSFYSISLIQSSEPIASEPAISDVSTDWGFLGDHYEVPNFNKRNGFGCPYKWPEKGYNKPPPGAGFFWKGRKRWWVKEWWGDRFGNCILWCLTAECYKLIYINMNDPTYYRIIGICEYEDGRFQPKVIRDPKTGKIIRVKSNNYEDERNPTKYGDPDTWERTMYDYDVERNRITVTQEVFDGYGYSQGTRTRVDDEPPEEYQREETPPPGWVYPGGPTFND